MIVETLETQSRFCTQITRSLHRMRRKHYLLLRNNTIFFNTSVRKWMNIIEIFKLKACPTINNIFVWVFKIKSLFEWYGTRLSYRLILLDVIKINVFSDSYTWLVVIKFARQVSSTVQFQFFLMTWFSMAYTLKKRYG